jgi:hypothetical protein
MSIRRIWGRLDHLHLHLHIHMLQHLDKLSQTIQTNILNVKLKFLPWPDIGNGPCNPSTQLIGKQSRTPKQPDNQE